MNQFRRLLLVATLASLTSSGFAADTSDNAGLRVGESELTLRQTVRKDNLWTIARKLMPTVTGATQNQLMAAILHRNPGAFEQGNMFNLRRGVALIVPSLQEIHAEDMVKADALFENQHKAWSEGRPMLPDQRLPLEVSPAKSDVNGDKGSRAASQGSRELVSPKREVTEANLVAPSASTEGQVNLGQPNQADKIKSGAESSEFAPIAVSQASTNRNNLFYVIGFASIATILYFLYLRRRNGFDAAESSQPHSVDATVPLKEVKQPIVTAGRPAPSKGMVVTEQVVINESLAPGHDDMSKSADEAAMKLDMAKALLELNREDAARTLLEEVTVEGGAANRNKAKKLLKRK
jgi:FimV-like protein